MAASFGLTIRQIAERTQMAETTVRQWVRSGRLESRRIGPKGVYRVQPQALSDFLDRR